MELNLSHLNFFHQPSYNLWMYEKYILTTSRSPLVYLNDPYCDYSIFHTPGNKDHLTINILFQLHYLNGIHTEEVDLLEFKRNNDLPSWYPVFQIQYSIKLKVSYTEITTLVQLIADVAYAEKPNHEQTN